MKILRVRRKDVSARRIVRAEMVKAVDVKLEEEKRNKPEPVFWRSRLTGSTVGYV